MHRLAYNGDVAGASWLFFRVARSTRMTQIWALRSRLEKQPTDLRRHHHYMRDGALGSPIRRFAPQTGVFNFAGLFQRLLALLERCFL